MPPRYREAENSTLAKTCVWMNGIHLYGANFTQSGQIHSLVPTEGRVGVGIELFKHFIIKLLWQKENILKAICRLKLGGSCIFLIMKQKPFDVHLILGDDNTGKEIATINVDFELKPENIEKFCKRAELRQPVGEDLIIKFDFSTQEGREKECIEYFESGLDYDEKEGYDYDLSPLQNWFSRPKRSGKLDLYESTSKEGKGRISLEYRIYKEEIEEEEEGAIEAMKQFKECSFHPDLNLKAFFYGDVETYKKNRVKLKLDYIDMHATSDQFKMKDFLNLIAVLGIFEEQTEEVTNHPIFRFLENAEEVQVKLKLASIRKLVQLYEIGVTEANTMKERKKQHPDIIKGLFKDEVTVTFIYSDTLAFVARYTYRSEAVLIRMLTGMKKYLKYFD